MMAASHCHFCADARRRRAAWVAVILAAAPACLASPTPLRDGPVAWWEDDRRPIPVPEEFEPSAVGSEVEATVSRPVARFFDPARQLAGDDGPAWNVNSLGEVPGSTWFTQRMGARRLSAADLAAGPGSDGPAMDGPWEIIGAKTEGMTMGFRIRDAAGQVWLLKFDPPDHPGQSIRAGVVSNLILHACGYNTPVDRILVFDREQLVLGVEASLRPVRGGAPVALTAANLDSVLQATGSVFDGRYHALASRYLSGIPLGPIRHRGVRPDDPNDRIPHEHRREWRALRVFGAWIGHIDTKIQNTLAVYEGEPGLGHVVHYLIDFASTLGTSGAQVFPKFNYEYGIDLPASLGRLVTLGFRQDQWQTLAWPEHLDEVGCFTAEGFEPREWRPIYPNSAFANLTAGDAYWAAKIIASFRNQDLRVMIEEGRYRDPRAVDWLAEHLGWRRDIIARTWFDRVTPLDYWLLDDGTLQGHDLALEVGIETKQDTSYRVRTCRVDERRRPLEAWSPWRDANDLAWSVAGAPPLADGTFRAVQWSVSRGDRDPQHVTVYLGRRAGVVAVSRQGE